MRNPWPMFFVLTVTGLVCIICPQHVVWMILSAMVVLFVLCIILPIKFDDWLAKKINPYILEYQQEHDLAKLESNLQKWHRWAITKTSRNMIQINWFCALLEQGQWKECRKVLEQIERQAKTTVDWMNYHLLMAEYAKKIGDEQLAKREIRLSEQFKTKLETKKNNPRETATARQSVHSFFLWLSFAGFLMIGGGVCVCLFPESVLGDLGAVAASLSLFALPVALVWLVVWIIRRRKEQSVQSMENADEYINI